MSSESGVKRAYNVSVVIQQVASHVNDISLCEGRDVVICLGRTQSGKSTLYNSLAHGVMHWCKTEEGECLCPLKVNERYPVAVSGDNFFSETKYPRAFELPDGKVFLDTRGFFDTSIDSCAEAAAAILTDIAVHKAKSVRIIWLQPYPLLVSGGVADLDVIGGVLNRVVSEDVPMLFLFNKEFSLDKTADRADKRIVHEAMDHEVGESEEIWPKFQEIALGHIGKIIQMIVETDGSKKRKFLENLREASAELDPSDILNNPVFEHIEERAHYLAHFSRCLETGRVLFIDPRFELSLLSLVEAIDKLPPALEDGSTSCPLNFTKYCRDLVEFRDNFNFRLKEYTSLLKARQLSRIFSVDQETISARMTELRKHEETLERLKDGKQLDKGHEQHLANCFSSSIKTNLEEQKRIEKTIRQIRSEIEEIEGRSPFVDDVAIFAFSFLRTPIYHLVYDKEPFIRVEEELNKHVERFHIVSSESPRFEVWYSLDEYYCKKWKYYVPLFSPITTGHMSELADLGMHMIEFFVLPLVLPFEVGYNVAAFFQRTSNFLTTRLFTSHVKFFIESKVHNRELIEEKTREIQFNEDNLTRLKRELVELDVGKTNLITVQHEIEKTKDEIKKLEWIKAFQERIMVFLGRKIQADGDAMTVENVIENCEPIVEGFFKQKDGMMLELLRILKSETEKIESIDVTSFYNGSVECAKALCPFHKSLETLIEQLSTKAEE